MIYDGRSGCSSCLPVLERIGCEGGEEQEGVIVRGVCDINGTERQKLQLELEYLYS